MFERFTDNARRAVTLSQEHARPGCLAQIDSIELLYGLCALETPPPALTDLGITTEALDEYLTDYDGRETVDAPKSGHIPFTGEAKRTLELALREALQLGHNYIGTDHLLLGMISLRDGRMSDAGNLLDEMGFNPEAVRSTVVRRLQSEMQKVAATARDVEEAKRAARLTAARRGQNAPDAKFYVDDAALRSWESLAFLHLGDVDVTGALARALTTLIDAYRYVQE